MTYVTVVGCRKCCCCQEYTTKSTIHEGICNIIYIISWLLFSLQVQLITNIDLALELIQTCLRKFTIMLQNNIMKFQSITVAVKLPCKQQEFTFGREIQLL